MEAEAKTDTLAYLKILGAAQETTLSHLRTERETLQGSCRHERASRMSLLSRERQGVGFP
jgi:hypothetical protein